MAPHERDHAHHCQTQQNEKNNFTHDDFMIHLHRYFVKSHLGSSRLVLRRAVFVVQLDPVPPPAQGFMLSPRAPSIWRFIFRVSRLTFHV